MNGRNLVPLEIRALDGDQPDERPFGAPGRGSEAEPCEQHKGRGTREKNAAADK
jgi:hypothetical protein